MEVQHEQSDCETQKRAAPQAKQQRQQCERPTFMIQLVQFRYLRQSIIEGVLDLLPNFIFFLEVLLEGLHFLGQEVVDLEFSANDRFELIDIGVNVVVHESHALYC